MLVKKIIFVFVMICMVVGLAGCAGNGSTGVDSQPEQTQENMAEDEDTEVPSGQEESTADGSATAQSDVAAFVGTWNWMNTPYYTFEAGGQGRMAGIDITWFVRDGLLAICNTPQVCGNDCLFPTEWYYEFDGDELTLTNNLDASLSYTYTRQ
ncbi:MAG: hypothetical protein FWD03_01175 [Defluviitaleaceae bacterium]|nr:hypothetical protein [Defluviitaleaceae bacterium]